MRLEFLQYFWFNDDEECIRRFVMEVYFNFFIVSFTMLLLP